ncbi:hypothetical protein A3A40_03245 [Candidatus Kaiserbacteria bacterium RIFCSPLOWO2_01_FULL_54_20]|uniref:Uncharacterized protein n=1 Tax=Candidatus Kaiserbacteria bacterium RIFCSPLOWO2_01_FULL_54_20 TaxID=1798513 RepID=A0A1F6EKH3_9BACT|nr:MAG: hypothetical protein A3A40_03245 [Candidatus Kaiserbacteria bacterium RIFCSPLOWO2_01_FULL_54_20]
MSKIARVSRVDFAAESGTGKRCHGRLFSLSAAPLSRGRRLSLACVVSKKVAPKAVERNLIKRRCREAVRAHMRTRASAPPLLLVFRAKKEAAGATFADILRDIGGLVDKVSDTRYNTPQ